MKRKGVSMVMTIVAIGVITVLAVSISAFTLASYKNTVYKDKRDKLKLRAESGIDYGIYELKQFINSNPNVLLDEKFSDKDKYNYNTQYGESDINNQNTFYKLDGNIHLKIRIYNDEINDVPTGRKLSCIKIESRAQYYSNGEFSGKPVTADEWIDKINIENDYFERIFHKSSFTTASKHRGKPGCFSIDENSHLTTSGSMFLQDNVNLEDVATGNFNMDEGEIKVKSPDNTLDRGFTNTHLTPLSDKIEYYKDIDNCDNNYNNSIYYPGWKNKMMDTLPLCNIATKDKYKAQLEGGDDGSVPTDGSKIINIPGTNIYSYAAKDNGTKPIDFEKLVDGNIVPRPTENNDPHGIYYKIISSPDFPGLPYYGRYYKLILIDGDLDINNDCAESFNNYLIYCTGQVTFNGTSKFYNCSLFANKIIFKNADVTFNGVLTAASKSHINNIDAGSNANSDLSPGNKGYIYSYLINNLDKFGDYLRFNVLKFSES